MSRATCPWEAELAVAALDALEPDQERAARTHAAVCPDCGRALAEFEQASAALGAAVVQVQAPRGLKRKVLRAAGPCMPVGANRRETLS